MEPRAVRESEYEAVDRLVVASGLPLDGIEGCRPHQFVLSDGDAILATAALEVHGRDAVLRSVAVDAAQRGTRLGERIVAAVLEHARTTDLRALYLLTETAAGFFPRFGFEPHPRDEAPAAIARSVEYCSVCPSTATSMVLWLQESKP